MTTPEAIFYSIVALCILALCVTLVMFVGFEAILYTMLFAFLFLVFLR